MKRKIDYSDLFLAGVYFLINKGKVVYVGESDCIVRRIGDHKREGKKTFDNFRFLSSKTFFWIRNTNAFVCLIQSTMKKVKYIQANSGVLNLALTLMSGGLMVL